MKLASLLVLSVLGLSIITGMVFSFPVTHATSTNGGSSGPDGISVITLPTTTSDSTDYAISCPGALSGCTVPATASTSWGSTAFSVTYTGTVAITITDCCYEGDYYSLWQTTDPTGLTGWTLVGVTDEVNTGSQLIAPTYDPFWTGTGTQYSSTTFNIPMTGTVLFAVRDELFDQMVLLLGSSCGGSAVVTSGCTATGISAAPSWSPAGFEIAFAPAATAGCLDASGSTSWPTVTFTDSSTATISVTGGAPAGVCASMTIEDLFDSQPSGTTTPPVSNPNYYDLSINGLTAGTAHVCFDSSLVSATTVIEYWQGGGWVTVATTYTSPSTVCGDIPVTALATASTPVLIGTSGVIVFPQFPGGSALLLVGVCFALLTVLGRKRGLGQKPATSAV